MPTTMNTELIDHKTIGSDPEPPANISARIICDSLFGTSRLTTFVLRYPRFIHCELMTHRALSKNSASSRAIPLKRMIQAVEDNPAHPEHWGAEIKGMQSGAALIDPNLSDAKDIWDGASRAALNAADLLGDIGLHKSICNRVLEPFAHMTVILTGETRGLQHFFSLRAHPAAQPEFQVLAYRMLDQWMLNKPRTLLDNQWHMPFGSEANSSLGEQIKCAIARCARVSYLTHDGSFNIQKDLELYEKLANNIPPHASPFEHVARASAQRLFDTQVGNFGHHWLQARKMLIGEFTKVNGFDAAALMSRKPEWIKI